MEVHPIESLTSILLSNDQRNMSALRPFLPNNYVEEAAELALTQADQVLITTGFYISRFQAAETDGPPGALAVGNALTRLGAQVIYVTDCYTIDLLRQFAPSGAQLIDFPIMTELESQKFANALLQRLQPTLLISVERCSQTASGRYLNSSSFDISAFTARIDTLFKHEIPSIGIGDGGNEIGMGCLAQEISAIPGLPDEPAATSTTQLIVSSVSNWGAYGLVAALSARTGQNLLPTSMEETELIKGLYAAGCFDGVCLQPTCGVDGFRLDENSAILERLQRWLEHAAGSGHDHPGSL